MMMMPKLLVWLIVLLLLLLDGNNHQLLLVEAFSFSNVVNRRTSAIGFVPTTRVSLLLLKSSSSLPTIQPQQEEEGNAGKASTLSSVKNAFDAAVLYRFACKKFQRYDNGNNTTTTITERASPPDPHVVEQAMQCLDLARRAPSGFNTQPYKVVLVQSADAKTRMAKYCNGPNAQRVKDADCVAVFLADREILRTMPQYQALQQQHRKEQQVPALPSSTTTTTTTTATTTRASRWRWFKLQFYIALFSSGYPLPRCLAAPLSFGFRTAFLLLSLVLTPVMILPTLSSAETWSSKNTMLVAMTYMLACSSRGLDTSPMEGFNARGLRKALRIPKRFAIPIIVCTGHAAASVSPAPAPAPALQQQPSEMTNLNGDERTTPVVGLRYNRVATPRYPLDQIVFQDSFDNKRR